MEALADAARSHGRRAALVALLLVGQVVLGPHQIQHRFAPDLAAPSGDCAVCHLASHMAAGGDTMVVAPPERIAERLIRVPAFDPASLLATPGYRSRAPPRVLSV